MTLADSGDPAPKTRILVICTTLSTGGAERDAANMVNFLDRRKFRVDLALMRLVIDYSVTDDVVIHDLGKNSLLDNFRAIWRIRELARSGNYDIVLSSLSTTSFLTLLATFVARKFPFWIARIDGDPLMLGRTEPNPLKRKAKEILQWGVFHRADSLLTNSCGSRDSAVKVVPGCRDKIEVIYNPVNLELIARRSQEPPVFAKPGTGTITLVSAARLEAYKGIDLVLRVVAELVEDGLDLNYVVCGTGAQSEALSQLAGDLGIGERVVFAGFVENPFAEMNNADIYVLASQREGLPNGLIEAQSLGVPAVATDCRSGPSEVIEHGISGLLIPVGDRETMSAAIRKLATNPDLRDQYGAAASERAGTLFGQKQNMAKLQDYLAGIKCKM